MPSVPNRRRVSPWTIVLLTMLLAACGPGTGGTGTGPDTGAITAPGVGTSPGSGDSLVAPIDLTGTWRAADLQVAFEPQRIRLQQGCRAYGYEGPWAQDSRQGLALTLRPSDAAGVAPAQGEPAGTPVALLVEPIDASTLRITLRDAAGVLLAGPLQVRRAEGAPALTAGGC